ncbi:MAG: NADPH-dependent oxidoreductase [bacterium]|nr:NADPH-dependent oxidoreductase [bacterium]
MNATMEILMRHRSVRRFQDRALPEGLLEELVACGQQASTSSNLQVYSIIHVAESQRKAELTTLCADQVQIHESAVFLAFCADLHRCLLAGDMHGGLPLDGDYAEALLVATVDTALVMQNVATAAESAGLGICMIGAMRNHPKAVGRFLGLPPHVYAVAGMCLGYPAEDPQVKPRLPLDAVLHREAYLADEHHVEYLEGYDREMVAFYESQGMHPKDPRWTSVAAGRAGQFHRREEMDAFLTEQGFRVRRDAGQEVE